MWFLLWGTSGNKASFPPKKVTERGMSLPLWYNQIFTQGQEIQTVRALISFVLETLTKMRKIKLFYNIFNKNISMVWYFSIQTIINLEIDKQSKGEHFTDSSVPLKSLGNWVFKLCNRISTNFSINLTSIIEFQGTATLFIKRANQAIKLELPQRYS